MREFCPCGADPAPIAPQGFCVHLQKQAHSFHCKLSCHLWPKKRDGGGESFSRIPDNSCSLGGPKRNPLSQVSQHTHLQFGVKYILLALLANLFRGLPPAHLSKGRPRESLHSRQDMTQKKPASTAGLHHLTYVAPDRRWGPFQSS